MKVVIKIIFIWLFLAIASNFETTLKFVLDGFPN